MLSGTYFVKDHEAKVLDVLAEIIRHGFGELTIHVNETKNFKTKIVIAAGRSWVFLIDKDIPELKDIL